MFVCSCFNVDRGLQAVVKTKVRNRLKTFDVMTKHFKVRSRISAMKKDLFDTVVKFIMKFIA